MTHLRLLCLLLVGMGLAPASWGDDTPTDNTADEADAAHQQQQLQAALTPDSQNPQKLREQALAVYQEQQTQAALTQLQQALQLDPEQVDTHYALGVVHLARASEVGVFGVRKNLRAAIKHFDKTIELDPEHTAAHYYLIQVLINAPGIVGGDQVRGETLNGKLAELSPLHHQLVKATLARHADDYQQAEQLLKQADQQHPEQSLVYYNLSELYLKMENHDRAIHFAEQFLDIPKRWDDTSNLMGLHLLAQAHAAAGQVAESQDYYRQALEQTQNPRLAERLKEEMAALETPNTDNTRTDS